MKKFGFVLLTCLSAPVYAESDVSVYLSTFSYHVDRSKGYNEVNLGLGVSRFVKEELEVEAGFYRNSNRKMSLYSGIIWSKQFLPASYNFRVGFRSGLITGYSDTPKPYIAPIVKIGNFILTVVPTVVYHVSYKLTTF